MTDAWRVVVTASRDYADGKTIAVVFADIASHHPDAVITVVNGQCDPLTLPTMRRVRWADAETWPRSEQQRLIGGDWLCDRIALVTFGWQVERHPADWKRHGRRGGRIRNTEMAAAGADEACAFGNWCADQRCPDIGRHVSHGTAHAASEFERFGILVRRSGPAPRLAA